MHLELYVTPLYCSTQKEAKEIMREAKEAGLTKKTYVWIVTQPVIGSDLDLAPQEFTEGMLGVHFDTSSAAMVREIDTAVTVFGHALNSLHLDRGVTSWAKQAMVQRLISPFLTTFPNSEPLSFTFPAL